MWRLLYGRDEAVSRGLSVLACRTACRIDFSWVTATHLAVHERPGGMCGVVGAGAAVLVGVAMVVTMIVVVIVTVIVVVVVGAAIRQGIWRAQCARQLGAHVGLVGAVGGVVVSLLVYGR